MVLSPDFQRRVAPDMSATRTELNTGRIYFVFVVASIGSKFTGLAVKSTPIANLLNQAFPRTAKGPVVSAIGSNSLQRFK